jgi:hypothetical protein
MFLTTMRSADMRDIKIIAWCDLCFIEGKAAAGEPLIPVEVPATQTFTLACVEGDDKRPSFKQLDLCEPHAKPYLELVELLANTDIALVGTAPRPQGRVAAPVVATGRPVGRPPSKNTPDITRCPVCHLEVRYPSLMVHIWNQHRPGETRPPQPKTCPECRQSFEPQGMSLHRKKTHGVDPLIEILRGVKDYVVTGREREEL